MRHGTIPSLCRCCHQDINHLVWHIRASCKAFLRRVVQATSTDSINCEEVGIFKLFPVVLQQCPCTIQPRLFSTCSNKPDFCILEWLLCHLLCQAQQDCHSAGIIISTFAINPTNQLTSQ